MVTGEAEGEDCLHALDDPEKLCRVLAQSMRFLHGVSDIDGVWGDGFTA